MTTRAAKQITFQHVEQNRTTAIKCSGLYKKRQLLWFTENIFAKLFFPYFVTLTALMCIYFVVVDQHTLHICEVEGSFNSLNSFQIMSKIHFKMSNFLNVFSPLYWNALKFSGQKFVISVQKQLLFDASEVSHKTLVNKQPPDYHTVKFVWICLEGHCRCRPWFRDILQREASQKSIN